MYHADKYKDSNDSLERFCKQFNATAATLGGIVKMEVSPVENFRDDGKIIHVPTNAHVFYDWEKRHTYYSGCGEFKFDSFGQFERKIRKSEIELSIQCSSDEKCFIIAWHNDFRKEEKRIIGSKTASGEREYDGKRFTKEFVEISYSKMDIFYNILVKAFKTNSFDSTSFKP